jgi:ankyrin repeat protein
LLIPGMPLKISARGSTDRLPLFQKEKRRIFIPNALIPVFLPSMETTEFFSRIREGNLESISKGLEANPELLHTKDPRGATPLIMASYYDHRDVVRLLLSKGARIDEKDGSGNTALMGVCFKGYEEMAKILLEAGADVNARNGMGGTCLIFAVTFNRENIAKLLITHGAKLDAVDAQGHTALYHARTQGLRNLVSLLENIS